MSDIAPGALSSFEQAVLDRWDRGMGSRAIAEDLGIAESRVLDVIACYDGGAHRDRRAREADVAAGRALLSAIRRAHPELVVCRP